MLKKISVLALAGMLALPAVAAAGAGGAASNLDAQIAELTKQLEALKSQMKEIKNDQKEKFESLDERAEGWDLASRIQFSGDIRSRLDVHQADTVSYYPATTVARGIEWFANPSAMDRASWGTLINAPSSMGTTGELLMGFGLTEAQTEAQLGQMFYGNTNAVNLTVVGGAVTAKTIANGTNLLPYNTRVENLAAFMKTFTPAQRVQLFSSMGFAPSPEAEYKNDTLWTTRLRMNMRAKATENVEVKARFVGYKTWGMQDSSMPETNENGIDDTDSPYYLNSRSFDGTSGRQPVNNLLVMDRAFVNWNNIGGQPIWFSVGRRPTTDGPPAHLRMGADERLATPVAMMDYPFDGVSVGYAYNDLFGATGAPGRIRFCYGRGFEAGPNQEDTGVNDVDFAGLSWDIYQKGNRFINIQSFAAIGLFNVPGDTKFPNPLELAAARQGLADGSLYKDPATGSYHSATTGGVVLANDYLDRMNMGNVYHTSGVYMDKYQNLNYFVAGGWSHTDPKATDEMGISLLSDFWGEQKERDGYCLYIGGRYDIPNTPFKIGAEFNHGTKYWLGFTPGHDDQYASKLYTRGNVYEVYGLYDIPGGEAVSKYGKAFMRLGYQHFDYDYTYSGMWLGTPNKVEDIKSDPLSAMFYRPIDKIDQVYLTLEAWF